MEVGAHIIVKGMVQGVGFRYFVYRRGTELGLVGKVKNLPGGDVDVVVEGDRSLIEELIAQIKVGPRSAQVRDVIVLWSTVSNEYTSFEIT